MKKPSRKLPKKRPVVARFFDPRTVVVKDALYKHCGWARTWTEAVRVVRARGYSVPDRRTPGNGWWMFYTGRVACTKDAFGVPALLKRRRRRRR